MESPASTQSAVTRCGRFVSYAAITLEAYVFVSERGGPILPSPHPACRGDRQDAIPDPPAHAPPCLRVQARQPWPRHAGLAALSRPQEHPAHGQVHRNGSRPFQGLLEELTLGAQPARCAVENCVQSTACCGNVPSASFTMPPWVLPAPASSKRLPLPPQSPSRFAPGPPTMPRGTRSWPQAAHPSGP